MNKFRKSILALMACLMVGFTGVVTSCDEDDNYDTNQFKGGVSLTAAQLQVTRGGYMLFKGSGLERIEAVVFPENVSVTNIETVDKYSIRCVVPEDAEPGTVKLVYDGGSKALETGTIAFTEPIAITEFTPSVKPGDILTVKGTYLNYISSVIFATGEAVAVESASRYELKVKVPIDASTGKFTIAYETVEVSTVNGVVVSRDTIMNEIPTETALEVAAPAITKLSSTEIKSGETLVIEGSQLNQIASVRFEGASASAVTPAKDIFAELTKLSVEVPAAAKDGEVVLVSYAGLEYKTAALKLVVPEVAISGDAASYGVGEKVVLSGKNLDLIAKAAFDGTEAVDVKVVDGKITLPVVAAAKSGDITLTLLNGNTMTVKGFVTTKPAAKFPTKATPLDKLAVESTLGSRVVTVKFGDLEAAATATENGFEVVVPLEAETGKVVLVMDNGEELPAIDFEVNAYTFCAVKEFASETTTIGDLLKCTVKNGSNLVGVKLNGEPTSYILNGSTLFVNVGQATGTQTITLVSSDETEVNYEVSVVGAGLVETVLYDIPFEVTGWGGYDLPVTVPVPLAEGALIRIRVAEANSELQFMDGYWGQGPSWSIKENQNVIHIPAEAFKETGYVDVDPTVFHDENGKPWWDGKIKFNANGVIVSSVSIVIDYSAPKVLFKGPWQNSAWGSMNLDDKIIDWTTVKAGQKLYFTLEQGTPEDWGWQFGIRLNAAGWPDLPSKALFGFNNDQTSAVVEYELTQETIDAIKEAGALITGTAYILNKIEISR